MTKGWVCYRQDGGRRCLTKNPGVKQKCIQCGAARPPRRQPKHMAALQLDYELYIELNGGDYCGICGRRRTDKDRRFDRDHDHRTSQPRGLLCHKCNRNLPAWVTAEWCDAAASYLRKAAA